MRSLLAVLVLNGLAGCLPIQATGVPGVSLTFPRTPVGSALPTETSSQGDGAPVVPPATEAPPAPVAGAPSSGGGGAPTAGGFGGLVVGLEALGDRPVVDALVALADGRETRTDASGRFHFDGTAPADGAYAVSHPQFRSAAVRGLGGGSVTMHLKPRTVAIAPEEGAYESWTVTGLVVDDGGVPLSGAQVVLADARGSVGQPASTGLDGRFSMAVVAPGGRVQNASWLAMGERDGFRFLGAGTGQSFTRSGGADLGTFTMARADQAVRADVTGGGALTRRTGVTLTGPSGERLELSSAQSTVPMRAFSGVRVSVDVEARNNDLGVATVLHRENVALGEGRNDTVVTGALLELPDVAAPGAIAPGTALQWPAVAGATGYALDVIPDQGQGAPWEAFSAGPSFVVPFGFAVAGQVRLAVSAWDGPNLDVRSVASVPSRALRLLPRPAQDFRRATVVKTIAAP